MNLFKRSPLPRRPVARPRTAVGPGQAAAAVDPSLEELTGEWTIDPAHSRIGFSVRHAMVSTVRGCFTEYESYLYFDGRDPRRSRAEIVMSAASVDTGVEQRDAHLVSPDFLDAATYPQITFRSTDVTIAGTDLYHMRGDLTIRDVTRPVVLEMTYIGHVTDPFGYQRAGFDGTTTINRTDWGLTYNAKLAHGGAMVSEKVRLQFDIAAIRTAPAE